MEEKKISEAFSRIYQENLWGDPDSRSGSGSNMEQTQIIRVKIPVLIERYGIKSIVDAPCGDVFWMKMLFPFFREKGLKYTGLDIVEEIVDQNRKNFPVNNIDFRLADLTRDPIPGAGLILTRDCLLHLSYKNILAILRNYKASGSEYLLVSTYAAAHRRNCDVGGYSVGGRALNLQKAPFNFPAPLEIFEEGCTEGNYRYTDKSLALWKLSSVRLGSLSRAVAVARVKQNAVLLYRGLRAQATRIMNVPKRIVKKILMYK